MKGMHKFPTLSRVLTSSMIEKVRRKYVFLALSFSYSVPFWAAINSIEARVVWQKVWMIWSDISVKVSIMLG